MEVTETATAAGSSNATLKFEPPTPTKKAVKGTSSLDFVSFA
uniref:Uncharacterized protein n=1 Tax=Solanum lycopersicum TaxID=4081 RepID=K4C0F9_SOLLC